jgi:putative polyketide hydroxylase
VTTASNCIPWATGSGKLLDSYRAERRPHALACVEASLGPERPNPIDGLVLGHVYQSAVITNDHTAAPTARDPVGEYLPAGARGIEPRICGSRTDGQSSTHSATRSSRSPTPQANKVSTRPPPARPTRIPLTVRAIDATAWYDLYGVEPGGAVLVRPDGYVAWRSIGPPTTSDKLANALQIAAGHRPHDRTT